MHFSTSANEAVAAKHCFKWMAAEHRVLVHVGFKWL